MRYVFVPENLVVDVNKRIFWVVEIVLCDDASTKVVEEHKSGCWE